MSKFFILLLLTLILIISGTWYSLQTTPNWTKADETKIQSLSKKIQQQGVKSFLSNKSRQVLNGEVRFDNVEFNALLQSSLQNSKDGRTLLKVSDEVRAFLKEDEIQITALINLEKLKKAEPKSRETIEKINQLLPFLDKSRMALSLNATPIARNKKLAIKDNFHLKIGSIPLSRGTLKVMGANVEKIISSEFAVKYLSIKSVLVRENEIILGVAPRV